MAPDLALANHDSDRVTVLLARAGGCIGGFFARDVIVSSLVLWTFVLVEGRRIGVRHLWALIVANPAVDVSLGLPLFLYLRERRLGQAARARVRAVVASRRPARSLLPPVSEHRACAQSPAVQGLRA